MINNGLSSIGNCCRVNEVGHDLPASTQLRLALAHAMAQCHIAASSMVHHAFQHTARYQFLGNAGERRTKPVPLHCGLGLRIDPCQGLARIDDGGQRFLRLSAPAIALHNLQSLARQQQLVVTPIFRVPQNDPAALKVGVADLDRRIPMAFVAVNLATSAPGQQLEAVIVGGDSRRGDACRTAPGAKPFLWNGRWHARGPLVFSAITGGSQTQHWRGGGIGRSLILLAFLFAFQTGIVASH